MILNSEPAATTIDASSWVLIARDLAHRAHEGQVRRDGVTPYIRHPEAVVQRVAGDPAAETIAWLHDVLEDTDLTEADLREAGLPEEVVEAVRLLTKSDTAAYDRYLARIKPHPLACKVKVADMLSNLADNPTKKQILKYAKALIQLLQ